MAALTENVRNKILAEKRFYFALKPEQLKIIEYIVKKRDTFGVLSSHKFLFKNKICCYDYISISFYSLFGKLLQLYFFQIYILNVDWSTTCNPKVWARRWKSDLPRSLPCEEPTNKHQS